MDYTTIDQIDQLLSTVNDNEDMSSLLQDLQSRAPNVIDKRSNSKPKKTVQIKEEAEYFENKYDNKSDDQEYSDSKTKIMSVTKSESKSEPKTEPKTESESNAISERSELPSHLTEVFGYCIPTATMYFIIILLIIAVALFFLTAPKQKEKMR